MSDNELLHSTVLDLAELRSKYGLLRAAAQRARRCLVGVNSNAVLQLDAALNGIAYDDDAPEKAIAALDERAEVEARNVRYALEQAKGYYESEMGALYGPAHAVIETLAKEVERLQDAAHKRAFWEREVFDADAVRALVDATKHVNRETSAWAVANLQAKAAAVR